MTLASTMKPPSGDHTWYASLGVTAIATVFGAFGGFAAIAPLDSAAIAPGRIVAESSTKPLQHLEGGIVREILVKESQAVEEGQVLFRLEPTQARANADMIKKQVDAALALEARLIAEREGAPKINFPAGLLTRRDVPETAATIADNERQFAERKMSLMRQTQILNLRMEQTSKQLSGVKQQEVALNNQLANLAAEIDNLSALQQKGLYPKSKLMTLRREYSRLEGQLGSTNGEVGRLGDVLHETQLQISQAEQKFREEAGQQLLEVRARLSDVRERLRVTDDIVGRVEIRAPQNGIVQGLRVHAPGAVINPGETLADLVPLGEKLMMAVRVSPLDIDNVQVGQRAEVRLPGFASRSLKTILGEVERVGADVMIDAYSKEPYYLARISVDLNTIPAEIEKRLQPGMPGDVLITTGERTILQYLFGPISDLIAKSMREQ